MGFPFRLPESSLGFARLTPAARDEARRAAASASTAISELLGRAVVVTARPVPAPAAPAVGVVRASLSLEALAETAVLEIDARLLARTVESLAGASARTPGALAATDAEQSVLDLLVLAAVDAVLSTRLAALVPRLAAGGAPSDGALVVALDLSVGEERGRGRLLVPAAAVAALRNAPELSEELAGCGVAGSLRDGTTSLSAEELAALAAGDVLLLDDGPRRAELVLPGGLSLRGSFDCDHLHVEEIRMTETQAAYPITLAVEVARVTITLGELAQLEAGAALPLGVAKDGAVVLRAGERAVARGQLVEIDGALGVRVAEIGDVP